MSDLISRAALLDEYNKHHVGAPGGARKLIEEAPAVDAVPVVRCKDCIYSRPIDREDSYEAFFGEDSVWCTHRDSGEYGLGFCYCGERDRA